MVQWEMAWRRAQECDSPFIRGKKKSDFRSVYYTQKIEGIAAGATSANNNQTFPAGAFVLGVTGAAVLPRTIKKDQYYADGSTPDQTFDRWPSASPGNLDMFSVSLQYTNDEIITPGGPCLAAALFGVQGNQFPARELIIDPSQAILATVKNEVSLLDLAGQTTNSSGLVYPISVHLQYSCMVPRSVG